MSYGIGSIDGLGVLDLNTPGLVFENNFRPYTQNKTDGAVYQVQAITPELEDLLKMKHDKGYKVIKWHER